MALFNRTKTIEFNSFIDGSFKTPKEQKQLLGITTAVLAVTTFRPDFAYAGIIEDGVEKTIMEACQPIIDLVQGLCYPVGFIMMSAGMLLVMMGQKHRGVSIMKWSGIGYLGFQFVPIIMQLLAEVSAAMITK